MRSIRAHTLVGIARTLSKRSPHLYLSRGRNTVVIATHHGRQFHTSVRRFADATPADTVGKSIDQFALLPEVKASLKKRGIESFFPIQEKTFDTLAAGKDLIGRARTGTGKTLAFAIPIVQRLLAPRKPVDDETQSASVQRRQRDSRRAPRAVIMTPTRELCKQVASEFMWLAPSLNVATIYGGSSYFEQEKQLEKADIVVGTPGRFLDHMDRGNIQLTSVEVAVLDEADHMLDMGFADEMDKILAGLPKERQTMLFSATIPDWVRKASRKFMQEKTEIVDLVGGEATKASSTVKHVAILTHHSSAEGILADVLSSHAGRTIVFTATKLVAEQLAHSKHMREDVRALHGDVSQPVRERTLDGFRAGTFRTLIATDVAARGLDIPEVDLVIQYGLPGTSETYIHRSGRCGRAGRTGTAITLYRSDEERELDDLETRVGITFERTNAPSFDDVLKNAVTYAVNKLKEIPHGVTGKFLPAATELLGQQGPAVLASALAHVANMTKLRERSLLTAELGYVTLQVNPANPKSVSPKMAAGFVRDMVASVSGKDREFNDDVRIGAVRAAKDGSVLVDLHATEFQRMEKAATEANASKPAGSEADDDKLSWKTRQGDVIEVASKVPALLPYVRRTSSSRFEASGHRGYSDKRLGLPGTMYARAGYSRPGFGSGRSGGDRRTSRRDDYEGDDGKGRSYVRRDKRSDGGSSGSFGGKDYDRSSSRSFGDNDRRNRRPSSDRRN